MNNPNSKLWLCQTNLENDYKNTLTFASRNAQRNYFIGDPEDPTSHGVSTHSYTEYTYLRLENSIKVDDLIDNIDTNNYLVLINNSKYYYYFITSMTYIDDQTTKINIELDVMQTYFFDITYKQTFVERKHVTDDTAGKHTIPEGLETGEYVTIAGTEQPSQVQDLGFLSQSYPVFAVTHTVIGTTSTGISPKYNNTWSGLWFMVVNDDDVDFARAIQAIDSTTDCELYAIFMVPKIMCNPTEHWETGTEYNFKYNYIDSSNTYVDMGGFSINKETYLDGNYVPRNKKLMCFPYNYFLVDSRCGNVGEYHYEDWTDVSGAQTQICGFNIKGAISVGCDIKITPGTRYRKGGNLHKLDLYKLPTCSWISDSYTNWLTQNAVNDKLAKFGTIAEGAIGAGMFLFGGVMSKVTGGAMVGHAFMSVFNCVASDTEHQRIPDEASGGVNEGNLNFAESATFSITKMSIKKEYAMVIDKFFDQFGYKVNTLEVPNIHTRRYWNYLKTQNCNFTGNIPQNYMDKIKSIFDNGITFWHDPSKMFDYTQTNSVLS